MASALAVAALPARAFGSVDQAQSAQAPAYLESDFNVRAFGAKGDGIADDTGAVLRAVAASLAHHAGRVYFPSGNYVLTAPIIPSTPAPIDFVGDGQSSILIWTHDGHAIWWKGVPAVRSSVRNLRIAALGPKAATSAAICCGSGATDVTFSNVWLGSFDEGHSRVPVGMVFGDGRYVTSKEANFTLNVTLENCYFRDISHVGLSVGAGGEFRVLGGRFIAAAPLGYGVGSIGILLCGWMGGFHLTDTDVSAFEVGMQIGAARRDEHPGAIQNREIFITHGTFDSCRSGLALYDDAYVSIVGCWAASSKDAQIVVLSSAVGGKLVIAGGTIFNGGHAAGNLAGGPANGLVMQAGTLLMSGVYLRSNMGSPIQLGPGVRYSITGCIVEANGKPPALPEGLDRVRTGNVGI